MAPARDSSASERPRARPRDPIRLAARLACFLLGLFGAIPVGLAAFLSSAPAERWAAEQTAQALKRELGLTATFDVRVRLVPLRLAIENLTLPASDGGAPFLKARSASVTPRFFSLLAGKLDLGDIEIDEPVARVVVRDGKLQNLSYRLPETKSKKPSKSQQAPFSSLSIGEGRFNVDIDGTKIQTDAVDLDVFAERGMAFEVALRASTTQLTREHPQLLPLPLPGAAPPPAAPPPNAVDEDILCRLDLRLHYEPGAILLRRLSLLGAADLDLRPGTRPSCELDSEERPGQVLARVSQLRVLLPEGKPPRIDGHVVVRAPVPLVNRFVRMTPLSGFLAFAGDLRWDGSRKLPETRGKLSGGGIRLGPYSLAEKLEVDVAIGDDEIRIPHYYMRFADGDVNLQNAVIRPFQPGVPITVERVDGKGMKFHSMMRDLNVTPNTIVHWDLTTTKVTKIGGTLMPLKVDAELFADTHDFEVTDKAFHDPTRKHMIGVKAATVRAKIGVRPKAFEIYDARTEFGKSAMLAKLVSIAYTGFVTLDVGTLTKLDLSDISPLTTISLAGKAVIDAKMVMPGGNPSLTSNLKIDDLVIGGFPVGSIESGKAKFEPLWVEFTELVARKGSTTYRAPSGRLDFDTSASIVADVRAQSDAFDLRDFFAMWHFDEDPRFDDVKGKIGLDAQVRYVFGGPEDKCGGGILRTKGRVKVLDLDMFAERYDGGEGEFDFNWFDRDATIQGVELSVPSVTLRKGSGLILGSFGLRKGARVYGTLNGTEVPLAKLDTLPSLLKSADGRVTASGELGGTLDALELTARAKISELRLGRATFGPSDVAVRLTPIAGKEARPIGTTKCGGPIMPPLDKTDYAADRSSGVFHADGVMLGGELQLKDVTITRQRRKRVAGQVALTGFDLGAAAEMLPQVALSDVRPSGKVSALIDIESLDMEDPRAARGSLLLSELAVEQAGYRVRVPPGSAPLRLAEGKLDVPRLALELTTPRGQSATFDLAGKLVKLGQGAEIDASLGLRPLPLATLLGMVPRVERADGMLSGKLRLHGALAAPRYEGGFELNKGEVALHGLSTPLSDISLALTVDGSEINITRGSARLGAGTLAVSGGAPLHGFELGAASVQITGRNLSLPSSNGIRAVADADLVASFQSARENAERALPRLTGNVTLKSFEYRRPVTMTADISSLTQRGKRSEFEAYDPNDDALELDISIRSDRPLKLQNNLVEAELLLEEQGLQLLGTNARFGVRGDVNLKPGGRIQLRRSEFEIKEGRIRFDDVTRIAPRVDVTAVTEYRRYNTTAQAAPGAPGTSTATSGGSTTGSSAAQGGRFRITMHAHGDADKLKIDLTSDPALAQDDIFLLITVGLTRAELDQAQSASVGESVALEALGTLTGADRAVKDAVPIIDELRFGSAYSSRTGRTEPTITIGKRLADRIRANVTSGVAESREIRSNVEWQLSPRVSVEGSYDNVNDISSSSLGNLGADVRWRMEFE